MIGQSKEASPRTKRWIGCIVGCGFILFAIATAARGELLGQRGAVILRWSDAPLAFGAFIALNCIVGVTCIVVSFVQVKSGET